MHFKKKNQKTLNNNYQSNINKNNNNNQSIDRPTIVSTSNLIIYIKSNGNTINNYYNNNHKSNIAHLSTNSSICHNYLFYLFFVFILICVYNLWVVICYLCVCVRVSLSVFNHCHPIRSDLSWSTTLPAAMKSNFQLTVIIFRYMPWASAVKWTNPAAAKRVALSASISIKAKKS